MFSSYLRRLPSPSGRLVAFFFCESSNSVKQSHSLWWVLQHESWKICIPTRLQLLIFTEVHVEGELCNFSYMICVFLALWWEWIETYQTYQKMLSTSKREKKWSWHAEPRLSIIHFQKESEFVFINKARHKRAISPFLPGSSSWPVTKFFWKIYLYLFWLLFHLHMLDELLHAECIILISSWS